MLLHQRFDHVLGQQVVEQNDAGAGVESGGQLAERLCATNSKLKVVFTSGYSPGMAGKDLSLLEGRNFLPKPYSVGKLAQFVREVLDQPESPAKN